MSLLKNHFKIISVSFLILSAVFFFSHNFSQATVISKTNTANTTLNTGLVGWYTFDGGTVTAVSTTDRTGITGSGNKIGGVTVGTGKIGQALKFDGVDDGVYAPNTSSISFVSSSSFSLSAWVKIATGTAGRFIARYEGVPYYNIAYGGDCTANKACFAIRGSGGGEPIAKSTTNVNDNKWHLITGVRNVVTDQTYLYFDGVREATVADSSVGDFGTAFGVTLGCHGGSNCVDLFLNGLLDDARIYNRALSAVEVAALYKQGGDKISKTDTTKPDLRSGLVGHWTFDGKDVTATQVLDKSGNNNTGTKNTTIAPGVGKIGQGIIFNDTPQLITIPYTSSLSLGNTGTISFWVKPKSAAIVNDNFFSYGNATDAATDGFSIITVNNNTKLAVYWKSGAASITVDNALSLNVWQQITLTNRGGALVLYKNGVSIGSGISNGAITTTTISYFIGGENQAGWFTNATMDDVRIYNRALSSAEIQQLYTQGGGKINKTDLIRAQLRSGLVGHWTFDGKDVTANTTTDKSGQGNDGTRTAVTTAVGKIGQAMKFNGTSSWINIGQAGATLTDNFTLSAWIKTSNPSNGGRIIARRPVGSTQWDWYVKTAGLSLYDGGSDFVNGVRKVNDNKWHLVMVVINGSNSRFYVDGTRDGAVFSPTITARVGNTDIGAIQDGAGFVNGLIDDARIYNRALSQAEITELYRMGR